MPITIRRTPNLLNYGMAVAKAAEKSTAADRSAQYANYLAGIQKSNQDYQLGLGNLEVNRAKTGLEAQDQANKLAISKRELEQKDVQLQMARDQMQIDKNIAARAQNISWVNAGANLGQVYNSARPSYGYGS